MTLIEAIRRANADGDYPTARDLADGLGRSVGATSVRIIQLIAAGRVRVKDCTGRYVSRRLEAT